MGRRHVGKCPLRPRGRLLIASLALLPTAVFASGCSGGAAQDSSCAGEWELISFSSPTIDVQSDEFVQLEDLGLSMSLTLEPSGVLKLDSLGEVTTGSWAERDDGDMCRLEMGSQSLEALLEGDLLILDDGETRATLERTS